jgi:hypothetical protein
MSGQCELTDGRTKGSDKEEAGGNIIIRFDHFSGPIIYAYRLR